MPDIYFKFYLWKKQITLTNLDHYYTANNCHWHSSVADITVSANGVFFSDLKHLKIMNVSKDKQSTESVSFGVLRHVNMWQSLVF